MRVVGVLADELGVEAELRAPGQILAAPGEVFRPGDHFFGEVGGFRGWRGHGQKHLPAREDTCPYSSRPYGFVPDGPSQTRQPPSTGRTAPVMKRAASSHRKTAASAQSAGAPGPGPSGCLPRRNAAMAGSPTARAAIGVSIRPGASTFTRMPSAA